MGQPRAIVLSSIHFGEKVVRGTPGDSVAPKNRLALVEAMTARVSTGIPGMDELLYDGIPKQSIVLLAGGPGTGKTIFGMQYLWAGISKFNELGIYVTTDERPARVRASMQQFGWDIHPYERQRRFAMVDGFTATVGKSVERERYVVTNPDDIRSLLDVVEAAIDDVRAERVVVDFVTSLYLTKSASARMVILQFKKVLSEAGCTSILISEAPAANRGFGGLGAEHVVDGVIRLDLKEERGELRRSLIVWKMQGTLHSMRRHPFEITSEGIKIFPERVYRIPITRV